MKLKKVIICFFAVLVSFILPIENTVHADTVHFRNCSEAWAAGYGDILVGEPGYAGHLDRDKDGTACEIFKSVANIARVRRRETIKQSKSYWLGTS